MDLNIDGNAAVVTASSSGLGNACAEALAREGVNVIINGRDEDRLTNAVDDLQSQVDSTIVGQVGDITDPKHIQRIVDRSISEFGRLDHLVTSAGGPPPGAFLDTTDRDWYDAYDLLVMSVVWTVKEAVGHLRVDGGGTIVMITSQSVKEALDDLVLSNSVRMSVIGLEKTLSKEFAPEIRTNAVLPGPHNTSRIQSIIEQGIESGTYGSYDEGLEAWSEGIPMNRMGDPLELGEVVTFLSSPRSSFINGAAIPVDGGKMQSSL